jgi:hypothetical protein
MAGIVIPAMLSSLPTIPNRAHPEEAALLRRRLEAWTQALTRSILRDASQSKSAVADFDPSLTAEVGQARLRCDAPQDEAGVWSLNMSRWSETVVSLIQFG